MPKMLPSEAPYYDYFQLISTRYYIIIAKFVFQLIEPSYNLPRLVITFRVPI